MSKLKQFTSNNVHKNRRADIVAGYADGALSEHQYQDLMMDERSIQAAITKKRIAGAALLSVIAFLIILASL